MMPQIKYRKCPIQQDKDEDLVCLDEQCDQDQFIICSWCQLKNHKKHSQNIYIIKDLITDSQDKLNVFQQTFSRHIQQAQHQFNEYEQTLENICKQLNILINAIKSEINDKLNIAQRTQALYVKEQDLINTILQQLGQDNFQVTKEDFQKLYSITNITEEKFEVQITQILGQQTVNACKVLQDLQFLIKPLLETDISQFQKVKDIAFEQLGLQLSDLQKRKDQLLVQVQEEQNSQVSLCRMILDKQQMSKEEIQRLKLYSQRRSSCFLDLITQNIHPGKGIQYNLTQSSLYPNIQNNFGALINDDFTKSGAATKEEKNSFIMATFDKEKYISLVYIGQLVHQAGFNKSHVNGKEFQFSRNGVVWETLFIIQGIGDSPNECFRVFGVYQMARYFRIYSVEAKYIAIGTLIFV